MTLTLIAATWLTTSTLFALWYAPRLAHRTNTLNAPVSPTEAATHPRTRPAATTRSQATTAR